MIDQQPLVTATDAPSDDKSVTDSAPREYRRLSLDLCPGGLDRPAADWPLVEANTT